MSPADSSCSVSTEACNSESSFPPRRKRLTQSRPQAPRASSYSALAELTCPGGRGSWSNRRTGSRLRSENTAEETLLREAGATEPAAAGPRGLRPARGGLPPSGAPGRPRTLEPGGPSLGRRRQETRTSAGPAALLFFHAALTRFLKIPGSKGIHFFKASDV